MTCTGFDVCGCGHRGLTPARGSSALRLIAHPSCDPRQATAERGGAPRWTVGETVRGGHRGGGCGPGSGRSATTSRPPDRQSSACRGDARRHAAHHRAGRGGRRAAVATCHSERCRRVTGPLPAHIREPKADGVGDLIAESTDTGGVLLPVHQQRQQVSSLTHAVWVDVFAGRMTVGELLC